MIFNYLYHEFESIISFFSFFKKTTLHPNILQENVRFTNILWIRLFLSCYIFFLLLKETVTPFKKIYKLQFGSINYAPSIDMQTKIIL